MCESNVSTFFILFLTSKYFALFGIVFWFTLFSLSSKFVLVTKFSCFNLAAKLSGVSLLISGVLFFFLFLFFVNKILILGILSSTTANAAFVAKPPILAILFPISAILWL